MIFSSHSHWMSSCCTRILICFVALQFIYFIFGWILLFSLSVLYSLFIKTKHKKFLRKIQRWANFVFECVAKERKLISAHLVKSKQDATCLSNSTFLLVNFAFNYIDPLLSFCWSQYSRFKRVVLKDGLHWIVLVDAVFLRKIKIT